MNAIVQYTDPALEDVQRLANLVLALRDQVFKAGQDYGVIPGTGDKPTLLLPGMEKLMRALNLRAEYIPLSVVEDFDKPKFMYRYECRMVEIDSGRVVATANGSANSYESKWRWRNSDRICPHCGKATIIKGKAEYGGGWLCFAKKGGCGAKFSEGDATIEKQAVGRIENPDIFDQVNTIDKIAQKRALSSAIKGAANVSEFFTVDLEDFQTYDVPPVGGTVDARITVEAPPADTTPAHLIAWTKEQRKAWVARLEDNGWHIDQIKQALDVSLILDYTGTEADAYAAIDAAVDAERNTKAEALDPYEYHDDKRPSQRMEDAAAKQLTTWAKATHKLSYKALCAALDVEDLRDYQFTYADAVETINAIAQKAVVQS